MNERTPAAAEHAPHADGRPEICASGDAGEKPADTLPVVGIRTDANTAIATGHLRRCLTIADALRGRAELVFFVSDEESAELLFAFSENYPCRVLHTDYRNPKEEAADYLIGRPLPQNGRIPGADRSSLRLSEAGSSLRLSEAGSSLREPLRLPDLLLLDSYYVTPGRFRFLSSVAPVCYLDDLMQYDHPAALIVNYDPAPAPGFYRSAGKVLAGACYAPLRPEFAAAGAAYSVCPEARELLITTGGTDPLDLSGRLVRLLLEEPALRGLQHIHLVLGALSSRRDALAALAASSPRVCLHENVQNMAALMASCDLAVSAAGTTLYELCAVGLPSVAFSLSGEQTKTASDFDRAGAVPFCGDLRREHGEPVLSSICGHLKELAGSGSFDRRSALSRRMRTLTDGLGAGRIADAILAVPRRTDL